MEPALLAIQDSKFKITPAVLVLPTSLILTPLVPAKHALVAKTAMLQVEPVPSVHLALVLTIPSALPVGQASLLTLRLSFARLVTLAA